MSTGPLAKEMTDVNSNYLRLVLSRLPRVSREDLSRRLN